MNSMKANAELDCAQSKLLELYLAPTVTVYIVQNRRPVCDSFNGAPQDDNGISRLDDGDTTNWFN